MSKVGSTEKETVHMPSPLFDIPVTLLSMLSFRAQIFTFFPVATSSHTPRTILNGVTIKSALAHPTAFHSISTADTVN